MHARARTRTHVKSDGKKGAGFEVEQSADACLQISSVLEASLQAEHSIRSTQYLPFISA